jgi:hypothetical protein
MALNGSQTGDRSLLGSYAHFRLVLGHPRALSADRRPHRRVERSRNITEIVAFGHARTLLTFLECDRADAPRTRRRPVAQSPPLDEVCARQTPSSTGASISPVSLGHAEEVQTPLARAVVADAVEAVDSAFAGMPHGADRTRNKKTAHVR